MTPATTERSLVERCRRGDEGAFQELVDSYKDPVFALIARSVSDRSRAEDLAQEVFLRIHRGLPYFRGEARLSTWVFRIVVDVCAAAPPTVGSLNQQAGNLEVRDRLEQAMARLPVNHRLLIAADHLEGVRHEDLAEALNLPLATVRAQLHRAKQQLRRILDT